ncbi:hemin transporter [Niveispirillum lacus]|uniref:Hemin transporter n=1 Tax=Niveispirillum lacus TaxID=1981099 RepID=A0A255Z1U4_9PROT|nr:ShlB/FhaC/HecB family hemolysin secretion/activation protein [Niveispirillum lacus]OYQ34620.1 hemin transporter [Niveispirillum lacus]
MENFRTNGILAVTLLIAGVSDPATAQDAGQILRDVERNLPRSEPSAPTLPSLVPPTPETEFLKEGDTVRVTGFRILSTLFSEQELQAQLSSYIGRDCTLGDLREAAAQIARYYGKHDYLARAILPSQTLENGIVTIQVLEARMGRVLIDSSSNTRLDPERAADFIHAQNAAGEPLRPSAIATGVSNLTQIPGMQALGVLDAGQEEGTTDVRLKLLEPKPVNTTLLVDNSSVREIGNIRALGMMTVSNTFGMGEQLALTGQVTKSSRYMQVLAGAPVMDGEYWLEAMGGALRYEIDKKYNAATPKGDAQTVALNVRWLGLRTSSDPVNFALGAEHKWTNDRLAGLESSDNGVAAVTFAAYRRLRDTWMGGGAFVLNGQLKAGFVDLSGNRTNKEFDKATARTQGYFGKANFSVARVQNLWTDGDARVTLSAQISTRNLNSAEQFTLGGLGAVRAYPASVGNGDQGALLNVEIGHRVTDDLRLSLHWDAGVIEQHKNTWDGWQDLSSPHNQYVLQGVGAEVQWTPFSNVQARATVSHYVGNDGSRRITSAALDSRRRDLQAWVQLVLTV